MTWRWRISFKPVAVALLLPALTLAATVAGNVELTNSKEPAVRKRRDYSGVVIWLEPLDRAVPAAPPRHAEMRQRDKQFLPHVVAISVGSAVDFPNLDPIYHNAFSNFSGQPFDVGLYAPRTSRSVTFRHPGLVRVFCNIHSTMSAVIAVLNTPWFSVTKPSGKYEIENVPPGKYQLHIFHERALPENLGFLEHPITVLETGTSMPLISISETGFIPAPHMNKYGKEYPPGGGNGTYPGAPKQ
jgi:plastocyanin